jgi:exoribonuclease R
VPVANVSLAVDADAVRRGMAALRDELEVVVDHPPDVVAEAEDAARAAAWRNDGRPDRTSVPLLTIDPPGSRDLDQAFFAERRGSGTRVWYAIADVASFVRAGGALDAECHRRGVTLYGPDGRVSLHPPLLAEGAASLLPNQDRPALLWCFDLDDAAQPQATRLERAIVRSRAQLTYDTVQEQIERGDAPEPLALLREIGELRIAAERARGGVSLPIPDQVVEHDDHHYRLAYRAPLVSEAWNAQISLLTGMEAARIMLDGGSGLLRTLDEPDRRTVTQLRNVAKALGVRWPKDGGYAEFVRSLDPAVPTGAALLVQATRLLRGAGYEAFGPGAPPERPVHSAVAAPYAHVTAPLRRLCDRATNEVVLAHVDGRAVPEWASASLEELPRSMADARRREGQYSRASLDLVEALVLAPLVGAEFDAVVVDVEEGRALLQLREPAAIGWADADGAVSPGDEVQARLVAADPVERTLELSIRQAAST